MSRIIVEFVGGPHDGTSEERDAINDPPPPFYLRRRQPWQPSDDSYGIDLRPCDEKYVPSSDNPLIYVYDGRIRCIKHDPVDLASFEGFGLTGSICLVCGERLAQ